MSTQTETGIDTRLVIGVSSGSIGSDAGRGLELAQSSF